MLILVLRSVIPFNDEQDYSAIREAIHSTASIHIFKLLAPLLPWQLARSLVSHPRSRWHIPDALAVAAALAWLAVLGANRLLPVALWEM
ncbi:hypothetical protein ICJ04_09510 [Stenotrophomonas sp. 169]|uniref:hypothetical protein n=1 Tax=Stenotrophomonas sp. 169 TaxID=2770322 RepID=UPI0016624598|nr:hypothetical protein [Stenotrophomonas sp. 169]QNR95821.1 hypothetical protein ICJ04_09510 [Stenotrophomonas sp. 169]